MNRSPRPHLLALAERSTVPTIRSMAVANDRACRSPRVTVPDMDPSEIHALTVGAHRLGLA